MHGCVAGRIISRNVPNSCVIFLAAQLLLTGCSESPVITISNLSSGSLSNVVVSGNGFTNQIPRVAPGTHQRVRVQLRGESALHVGFDVAGKRNEYDLDIYIEGNDRYRVKVTVANDLGVSARYDRSNWPSTFPSTPGVRR